MPYTVAWKTLPGKALIREEVYDDLDEARSEANIVIGGPHAVEVTVTGDDGQEYYTSVSG